MHKPLQNIPHIMAGMVQDVPFFRSPNFGPRPKQEISLLVIHNISLPPKVFGDYFIERFFLNSLPTKEHPFFAKIASLAVSAHFCIRRTGEVRQFVSCLDRAWHAGVSLYHGRDKCNDFAIGIELEGADEIPFTEEQYQSLARLTVALQRSYPDLGSNITGHSDIAPRRKTDPGIAFNWDYYLALVAQYGGVVVGGDHYKLID